MFEIPSSAPAPSASSRRTILVDRSDSRSLLVLECVAVFVLGVAFMNYFYAASVAQLGGEIGVPEYDSYYHVAMSSMLPEHGLLKTLPWLQYVYWRNEGDDFVSHHVGFHVMLLPFVQASNWLTGDYLAGGRWAMSFTLGANMVVFFLLLRAGRVPWPWLWIALFLLLPEQFFSRHGFIRAIGPSFLFMQLTLLMLFLGRYIWAGVVIFLYVQLYLGAVMYGPVIVALYAFSRFVGPRDSADVPWKMVLITAGFWVIGVAAYPYSGIFEFLYTQVFKTGLAPTIEVGREWKPYTDPWFLVVMAAPLLTVWVSALVARLRMGPPLDARATALLLLQFAFLILTCKARRFIEYWPPLCLLSAAYLAAPVLCTIRSWFEAQLRENTSLVWFAVVFMAIQAGFVSYFINQRSDVIRLLGEYRIWAMVVVVLMLAPLIRVWTRVLAEARDRGIWGGLVTLGAGALLTAAILTLMGIKSNSVGGLPFPGQRLKAELWMWGVLVALYVAIPPLILTLRRNIPGGLRVSEALGRSASVTLIAYLLPATTIAMAAPRYQAVVDALRCNFDLAAIRKATDFLKSNSKAGDIVFTDDWDVFPVLFYHDRVNYYCVGLDPEFTNRRRPDLWSRYVKVTRAETPGTITIPAKLPGEKPQSAPVRMSDIRDHFKARWVICDRDHRKLALALVNAPELAELAYPSKDYEQCSNEPYLIFRIRGAGEAAPKIAPPRPDKEGRIPLSKLRPTTVQQGYGDLGFDRTVDGHPMKMRGKSYAGGLGTHAPSTLIFNVPDGAAWFEAVVGIDDETTGQGSVVASVALDGRELYESPVLKGNMEPVVLRLPVHDGKQLVLRASATRDGQRFDHVNWADARFVISGGAASRPAGAADGGDER
ncbi:MAG: NPCBM/NEW2 domain-containing protein [Phycisphaerales bacterium]|nr:NPCBM/NEW2 domain-containing protein [Phycisphaerales bacterium]